MKRNEGMPVIHVGIMQAKEIKFELTGDYHTVNEKHYSGMVIARYENNQVHINHNGKDYNAGNDITFIPGYLEKETFKIFGVTIGIGFHWEKSEDQIFRGSVKILADNGNLTIVNIIPVEDYLTSVISSEMSAKSSVELLKSHAVISRSWLMAQIEKRTNMSNHQQHYNPHVISDHEIIRWYDREDHTLFDVCADDHCQRYQGITKASTKSVEEAIKETSGEVLVYDDKLCDSRFSKCCGGVTELFENVWEPVVHPYLAKVYDHADKKAVIADLSSEESAREWIMSNPPAFCNTTDQKVLSQVLNDYDQTTHNFYRWKVIYTAENMSDLVKRKTGIDFGLIKELEPVERGVSGRIIKLRISGTKKSMIIGKELEIRKALSETHLYSSAFVVEKANGEKTTFTFHGAGWGHGVGLCQIGAAVMGEKGYSYKQILLHYFRGANIEKRW